MIRKRKIKNLPAISADHDKKLATKKSVSFGLEYFIVMIASLFGTLRHFVFSFHFPYFEFVLCSISWGNLEVHQPTRNLPVAHLLRHLSRQPLILLVFFKTLANSFYCK